MPNYNEETGTPFGVHGPNSHPIVADIINDVIENGLNLTHKRWRESVYKAVEDNKTVEYRTGETAEQSLEDILLECNLETDSSGKSQFMDYAIGEHYEYDVENGWWLVTDLAEAIIEYATQECGVLDYFDENEYIQEYCHPNAEPHKELGYYAPNKDRPFIQFGEGVCHVGVNWLGGAPLLWVYYSSHIVDCRACSPCVPGAGDLDNACETTESNQTAYCIPDWLFKKFDGHMPDSYRYSYRTDDKYEQ